MVVSDTFDSVLSNAKRDRDNAIASFDAFMNSVMQGTEKELEKECMKLLLNSRMVATAFFAWLESGLRDPGAGSWSYYNDGGRKSICQGYIDDGATVAVEFRSDNEIHGSVMSAMDYADFGSEEWFG